mmetsp:Transcript_18242/g.26727  ORF Transcript_18242/g.26727 Transcript_18242/m.26727 type:complete len:97 (+) Transcript_18242:329-619(+)
MASVLTHSSNGISPDMPCRVTCADMGWACEPDTRPGAEDRVWIDEDDAHSDDATAPRDLKSTGGDQWIDLKKEIDTQHIHNWDSDSEFGNPRTDSQ